MASLGGSVFCLLFYLERYLIHDTQNKGIKCQNWMKQMEYLKEDIEDLGKRKQGPNK